MIVNGNELAETLRLELKERVGHASRAYTLGIISMSDAPVTKKYLERKKKFAESIGVHVKEVTVPVEGTEEDLLTAVRAMIADTSITGVLVQLPLPARIQAETVLNVIPPERDPDVLSLKSREHFRAGRGVLPPVIGAMKEILARNGVSLLGKQVVVVGEGNLVGKPARTWAELEGARVTVVTEYTRHPGSILKDADVIISGAGSPGLVKPDVIKSGAVLLDAGTTDVSGSIQGDADPGCAPRCSLFTPVPGGIGPVTIAMVFKNLLSL